MGQLFIVLHGDDDPYEPRYENLGEVLTDGLTEPAGVTAIATSIRDAAHATVTVRRGLAAWLTAAIRDARDRDVMR